MGVVVVGALIALVWSLRFDKFELSDFAYQKLIARATSDQELAVKAVRPFLAEVKALRYMCLICLAVIITALLGQLNSTVVSILTSIFIIYIAYVLARLSFVQKKAGSAFVKLHPYIIKLARILKPLWGVTATAGNSKIILPESTEELVDQLHRLSASVIQPHQRQRIETVIKSEGKTVKNIMTRKKFVVTVEPSATLGPIVLADLQKSGHGYFPVMTKKGEPEGVLALIDIANIHEAKQRTKVRESMDLHITWAEEDMSLTELADLFLQEKQYLVLVRDLDGSFTGVVTIADLMKHLVGITKGDL